MLVRASCTKRYSTSPRVSPKASKSPLIDNTIVFNLVRSTDSTAWLNRPPAFVGIGAEIAALAILLAIALGVLLRNPSPFARCALAIVGVILVILVGHAAHTNYLLWWLPMFCALLAAFVLRPVSAVVPAATPDPAFAGAVDGAPRP